MLEINATPHPECPEVDLAEPAADIETQPDSEPAAETLNPEQARLFEATVVDHYDKIVSYFRSHGAVQDAEDLAQETFIRVFKGMSGFTEQGYGMRPWLYKIAHNTLADRARAFQRRVVTEPVTTEGLAEERAFTDTPMPSPEPQVIARDQEAQLQGLIGELPAVYQAVAAAQLVDGLNQHEVAERFGLPPATVRSRTRRARLHMEELLTGGKGEKFGFDRPTRVDLKGREIKRGTHS